MIPTATKPKNALTTEMFGPKPIFSTTYGYIRPMNTATPMPTSTARRLNSGRADEAGGAARSGVDGSGDNGFAGADGVTGASKRRDGSAREVLPRKRGRRGRRQPGARLGVLVDLPHHVPGDQTHDPQVVQPPEDGDEVRDEVDGEDDVEGGDPAHQLPPGGHPRIADEGQRPADESGPVGGGLAHSARAYCTPGAGLLHAHRRPCAAPGRRDGLQLYRPQLQLLHLVRVLLRGADDDDRPALGGDHLGHPGRVRRGDGGDLRRQRLVV